MQNVIQTPGRGLDEHRRMRYRRLLLPTDFGPATVPAVQRALALVHGYQAQLTMLHVLTPLSAMLYADADHLSAEIMTQLAADCQADSLKRLQELVPPDQTTPVSYQVVRGELVRTIVASAIHLEADLIIMGRRPYHNLWCYVRRQVIKRVSRHAPCPVLVVEGQYSYEFVHE